MTLAFFVTLALAVFYLLYRGLIGGPWWTYGFYLILGVGVLAKGPVGLVIPAIVIFSFLILRKRWDFFSRLLFHRGVFLALAVGAAWYGLALMRGGEDFFNRQVLHENLARFFVYGEGGTGHQKPLYYYLPYLFLEGLPWSLFLPFMIVAWVRRKSYAEEEHLFLMVWAGAVFVFFSLAAGKRSVYLLPLYPPLSLLAARWFQSQTPPGSIETVGLRFLAGLFSLVCVALTALLGLAVWGDTAGLLPALAARFSPRDPDPFLMVEKVLGQPDGFFFLLLGLAIVTWLFLTWDILRLHASRVPLKLCLATLLVWLLARGTFVPVLAYARSYKPFMDEVNRRVAQGDRLYLSGGRFDSGPLFFYRGTSIPHLAGGPVELSKRLRSGSDHVIMSEGEWLRLRAVEPSLPEPALKSEGRGPDGDAPLVLVRGVRQGA